MKRIFFTITCFLLAIGQLKATNYYTTSASATLAGNSAASANWTTNSNGTTGLGSVTIAATDNLFILSGATVTVSAATTTNDIAVSGGTATTLATATFQLTVNGNLSGTCKRTGTGLLLMNGAGKSLSFVEVAGSAAPTGSFSSGGSTSGGGIQIGASNTVLAGATTTYGCIFFSNNTKLSLSGYALTASLIRANATNSFLVGSSTSSITLLQKSSFSQTSYLNFDQTTPGTTNALNALNLSSISTGFSNFISLYNSLSVANLSLGTNSSTGTITLSNSGTSLTVTNQYSFSAQLGVDASASGTSFVMGASANIRFANETVRPIKSGSNISINGGTLSIVGFSATQSVGNATTLISGNITGVFSTLSLPTGYTGMLGYPGGTAVVLTVATTPSSSQFIFYNSLHYPYVPGNTSSIYANGNPYAPFMKGFLLDYAPGLYGTASCTPNNPRIIADAQAALLKPGYAYGFDSEIPSWPTNTSSSAFIDSLANFIKMIDTFKMYNNQTPISFYGLPPYPHAYQWSGVNANLANVSSAMLPLANVVDYYSPSFYNRNTDDTVTWRKYVDTIIAVIQKYYPTKPIYPWLSPQYTGGAKDGDFMDTATWTYELNYMYAKCNGGILWSGTTPNWDADAAWWQVTKKFMARKGLIAPLVADSFYINGVSTSENPVLRWLTSVDTTTNYYQIERSTDNISFTAVSGTIAKNGGNYTMNGYNYTDTVAITAPVYYRLKAVAISGGITYIDTIAYSMYKSAGTGVTVDLASAANWLVNNGSTWVAATVAPTNLANGRISICTNDTWQNNTAAVIIAPGVVLYDSATTGTFSTTYSLKNSGNIVFCGNSAQTIPGKNYVGGNWGSIVINNNAGVTTTQSVAGNFLAVNKLVLQAGIFKVTASGGQSVSFTFDSSVVVGSGSVNVTNAGTNYGISIAGKAAQVFPSGTFYNNTAYSLGVSNPQGFTYNGPLTVTNNLRISFGKTITVGGDLAMGSLTVDSLGLIPPVTTSGNATVNGALTITKIGVTAYTGQQLVVINATNPIVGNFSSVSLPVGYAGTVASVGNQVILTIAIAPGTSYASLGTGVSVDLNTNTNWLVNTGSGWAAASTASISLNTGSIIIRPTDTWNNASAGMLAAGVILVDSAITGTFSTTNKLNATNCTLVYAGTTAQTMPVATSFASQTVNNLVIANTSGVTVAGFNYLNIVGLFQLSAGTITTNSSFYLSGQANVVAGNINSSTNVGFLGTTAQTIPANMFTNNTVVNLNIKNAAGVTLAPNAVVNISGSLSLQSGNLGLSSGDSLSINGTVAYTAGGIIADTGAVVVFNGTSAQSIPTSVFTNNQLANMAISNANGVTIGGGLSIGNSLSVDGLSSTITPLTINGTNIIPANAPHVVVNSFATTPTAGQQFTLVASSAISGAFNPSPVLPSGYAGTISNSGNNVVLTLTSILPLDLVDFMATTADTKPKLQWVTSNEVNTSQFIVERGNDGRTFSNSGTVAAQGAGSGRYNFVDNQPFAGINYYRLKMLDKDGSSTYSKTLAVNATATNTGIAILPNPVHSSLYVTHPVAAVGSCISIYNVAGSKLAVYPVAAQSVQTTIDVSTYGSGSYVLQFENNGKLETKRFIKL